MCRHSAALSQRRWVRSRAWTAPPSNSASSVRSRPSTARMAPKCLWANGVRSDRPRSRLRYRRLSHNPHRQLSRCPHQQRCRYQHRLRNRCPHQQRNRCRRRNRRGAKSSARASRSLVPRRTPGPAVKPWDAVDLRENWWARTVSNRRPLVCKTRALPLSYAPRLGHATRVGVPRENQSRAARASTQTDWSRASPGDVHSANRTTPSRSTRNVPRSG